MGEAQKESRNRADAGIITFHCSDNYGAVLQAYGLKSHLRRKGIKADVVRYEPCFLTGRHWWIPYLPEKNILKRLMDTLYSWGQHLLMKRDFFRLRYNMRSFRKRYLFEAGQRKILFVCQLKRLPYQNYIVGSDQIWNPELTYGLRKAYFGAFENKHKKRVTAYGASLGGDALDSRYEKRFSELLMHVDAVSVREEAAVPYIKKFRSGDIQAVLDPVFFLKREEWMEVENPPEKAGYILVYITEYNKELIEYVKKISKEKGLPVTELKTHIGERVPDFQADYTAGPAEFLGYIHRAEYVVTNSFHAAAFSIIYQKQFIVFPHSSRNARLYNILHIHGLESRLWGNPGDIQMDAVIDWEDVERRTAENMLASSAYLLKHL